MNDTATPVAGRRVTVMGLGLFGGGAGAARWALRQGAHVTVTDLRDESVLAESVALLREEPGAERLRFILGRHDEHDFTGADLVIVNPAVPPTVPLLASARRAGTEITTAIALLLDRLPCRVVAITGTHGKSSTAHFTCDLVRAASPAGARVWLGGNIGGSLLDDLATISPDDTVVLELSSYQLEHLAARALLPRIDVAALTNLGVDHLERHGTVEAYHRAKLTLLDLVRSGGATITPVLDVDSCRATTSLTHGEGGDITVGDDGLIRLARGPLAPLVLGDAAALRVPGTFQQDNLAVALAAVHALGLDHERAARAIPTLRGLPHRMEALGLFEIPRPVEAACQIQVIDNGVSTTPESTLAAVASIARGPAAHVLVAGGQAKRGVDDAALAERLARDDWILVPFGAAAERLAAASRAAGARVATRADGTWPATAEEAAAVALRVAAEAPPPPFRGAAPSEGAAIPVVLFSPACASFDRYPNFESRALAFREAVQALAQPEQNSILPAVRYPWRIR